MAELGNIDLSTYRVAPEGTSNLHVPAPETTSAVEPDVELSIRAAFDENTSLYNDNLIQIAQKERPWYRQAAFMAARGSSNKEIAEHLGRCVQWVGQVLRHPFVRQRIVEEINKAGRNELDEILKQSAADSIHKIIELRDDPDAPKQVQLAAANSLLDRFLGKPTQKIETRQEITNFDGEKERLDAEITRLEEQERILLGKN